MQEEEVLSCWWKLFELVTRISICWLISVDENLIAVNLLYRGNSDYFSSFLSTMSASHGKKVMTITVAA